MANEEIIILKVLTDLKQPVQSVGELDKRVKTLRKTLKESPKEGTKAFEDLAQQISKRTGKSIEDSRKLILKFQQTATKEIQKGTAALKEFNSELREIPANANSIQALRNQVKKLEKEVVQLDTSTQEFVDKSQELRKTRDRLKELEQATGDARRNVGNYTDAIKKAISENLNFNKRLQGLSKTLKVAFGLASIRTAIGAFGRLYDAIIERNGEANQELQNLTKSTSNLSSSFINLASDALASISKPLQSFINAIAFTFDKIRELAGGNTFLGKTFQFIGRVISNVIGALGKFPAFFAGIAASAKQLATNIKNNFSILAKDVAILGQQINQFNPFSSQTTEEINSNIAKLRAERAKLVQSNRTLAESFSDAFNATLAQQEAYNKEVESGKRANKNTKERSTLIQRLEKEQKALEDRIKNLIARDKDYSKEQEQLRVVTERLTRIQEKFNEATNFTDDRLAGLTERQQQLTESIRQRLLAGEDVSDQVAELTAVTKELIGVDQEFEKINQAIQDSLTVIAEGSLKDYENQITILKEQQEGLNITSEEYLELQRQIDAVENKRTTTIDLINQGTSELNENTKALNEQLSDSQAQKDALNSALERISKVDSATAQGAEKIKQIEQELAASIEQINFDRLVQTNQLLTNQIQALEAQKQKELDIVGDNEQLKAAVEAKFQNDKTQLQLQQTSVQADILKAQLDQEKAKNQESFNDFQETENKKQQAIQKGLQFTQQVTSGIFQIISNLQAAEFEKLQQQLTAQEAAALKNAEIIGATEAQKQAIQEEFAKKRERLEKEEADKRKALAITQAVISTALAVLNGLNTAPLVPAGLIAAGIAAALGAVQIGIIASQKFALGDVFDLQVRSGSSKYAKGAYLKNGAYHSGGGMPIINPYTGNKVAEIEKGEGIVNRMTMASNKTVTMTGRPYDIISSLNNMNGYGVKYPNAKSIKPKFKKGGMLGRVSSIVGRGGGFGGGYSKVSMPKNLSYGFGGRFGVSSNVLKLQQGAIVASTVTQQARKLEENSSNTKLLEGILDQLIQLNNVNEEGFANSTTTTEDLATIAQIRQDEDNAS